MWDGDGKFDYFVGNYDDWQRQKKQEEKAQQAKAPVAAKPAPKKSTKLSYKLQRELDELPITIEQLEEAIEAAGIEMAKPEFFKQAADAITAAQAKLAEQQSDLAQAYERWEELEALKNG